MKRVLISEDHTMFAMMIKMWLQQDASAEVVGVAPTGAQTISMVHELKPDIILQDMMLSDMQGVDIIRRIRQDFPALAIFAMSARANLAKLALEAGANGCMLKEDSPQVIRHILDWDTSSGIWVSPLLGEKFFTAAQELLKYNFTVVEMNILRNITLSNTDIAIVLGISEGTVRNTLSTIYQKTSITTRPDLARYVQDILLLAPSQNVS
ncbi:MAG: response regulator transcription factor [Ignavibacteria bacterium]|nr:response regulator transcription factor [Ignavibacteria bacterium]MBL7991160.1 response regulator transcription factor [Candidatus Kapabacteria bacterium]